MKENDHNMYMQKFDKRFFVKTDEDQVRIIESKFGKIAPYAPEKQLLGVWCINLTPRKKKAILKRLSPFIIEVHQDCECEFGTYFHEKDLDVVAKIICARRKRILSEEQRKVLIDSARRNFAKPKK